MTSPTSSPRSALPTSAAWSWWRPRATRASTAARVSRARPRRDLGRRDDCSIAAWPTTPTAGRSSTWSRRAAGTMPEPAQRPQLPARPQQPPRHLPDDVRPTRSIRDGSATRVAGTEPRWQRPHVAAAAALVIASGVLGRHPSPDQVLARLEVTAQTLGGLEAERRLRLRAGRRGRRDRADRPVAAALGPSAAFASARPDDQYRARRVVRDLVGHGARAGIASRPSCPCCRRRSGRPLLLGHIEDRVGGVSLPGERLDRPDPAHSGLGLLRLEQREHVRRAD